MTLLSTGDHQTGTCSDLAGVIPRVHETQVNIIRTQWTVNTQRVKNL